MSLLDLPDELLLMVTGHLCSDRSSINAFAKASRSLYGVLNEYLYYHHFQYSHINARARHVERSPDTVQKVLEYGVNASQHSVIYHDALSLAAEYGREGFLKQLLARFDMQSVTASEELAELLAHAVRRPDHACIRLLVTSGADPHHPVSMLKNMICWPASRGDLPTVELLLSLCPSDPRIASQVAKALEAASFGGHDNVVEAMLARAEVIDNTILSTAAWNAAENGHLDMLKRLMTAGADPNFLHIENASLFSVACLQGHEAVVRYLLSLEHVDHTNRSSCGRTALAQAAEKGHLGVVKLLVEEENFDYNAQDTNGIPVLIYAVIGRNEEVVRLLLTKPGINIHAHRGLTALDFAERVKHEGIERRVREYISAQSGSTVRSLVTQASQSILAGVSYVVNGISNSFFTR